MQVIRWQNIVLQQMMLEKLGIYMQKMNFDSNLTYIQNQLKIDHRCKCKLKTITLSIESIEETFVTLYLAKIS